jgi:ubiquinone/menaquinone biosynthesis C-methylase UbiE
VSSRDIARFDRMARGYDRHPVQRLARPLHAELLRNIDSPGSALDIGCGTGALLGQIGARWPQAALAGLDAAPGMVAMAHEHLPRADIRHGFAESLPWADESFDVVTTSLSFHHWRDKAAGIREAARVLRPGGRFLLADVDGDGFTGWAARAFAGLTKGVEEFLPSPAVATLMAAAGLHDVDTRKPLRGLRLLSGRR